MCGICGFMNLQGEPVDTSVGQRMMDLLWHRGPDGGGQLAPECGASTVSPSVFLGHRRLKIIDLSEAARQPLSNEHGTVWVTFNGEIYNFQELRQELQGRGHTFRSCSDTETIVHAYEEFGDDCVQRLDGMFAFALWDSRRRRLMMARDRSGKKPLFYTFDGVRLTFASEIKALLSCPWIARCVAVENIPEFLTFGYVNAPRTLYRGIVQVPPASYVVVDREGLQGPFPYWQLNLAPGPKSDDISVWEAAGRVRQLLTEAVARRLISDVPLGALLSGGLDSSIVVGLMSQLLGEPVRTFTIGMADDLSFDERPYAAIAARYFKTEHTEFMVNADAIGLLERLLWHYDQPFGDPAAIPTYLVSKLARQQVTVVLNGDGGDEVFAGYDSFLGALMAGRIPHWLTPLGHAIVRCLPRRDGYYSVRRRLARFLEDAGASAEERFLSWITLFNAPQLMTLLRPEVMEQIDAELGPVSVGRYFAETKSLPLLHRLLYLNFMTFLPDDLHVKMDRMSMANALETRSPMLDTALVEFVAGLPPSLKIRRTRMKYILRLAFHDLLPAALLKRRKHGFGLPVAHWFRHQLRSYVDETLLSPHARLNAYLNQDVIRTLFEEHVNGVRQHWGRLWALLTFEVWLRMFEEGSLWAPCRAEPDAAIDVKEVKKHSYA